MSEPKRTQHPTDDPAVKSLLKRMDPSIAGSFSLEQLMELRRVVGLRGGRLHSIDARTTVKLPFVSWSFYLVFLAGKNRRPLTDREKAIAAGTLILVITGVLFVVSLIGLLALYLLKSWLGINLFDSYSTGIWSWFKSL